MKAYRCRACDQALYFGNSTCVACGTALAYARAERAIVPVDEDGRYVAADGRPWWRCRHLELHGCTWLAPEQGGRCTACDLIRTRPADDDAAGLEQLVPAATALRHLVVELDGLGFPVVDRGQDAHEGLAFDLLSTSEAAGSPDVVIGHADGVITLDLAESDDAHRERVRADLDEPYRTMLGHLRHEVGHYYEWQLVRGEELMGRCRELFGDESVDYQQSVQRHYAEGPLDGWREEYLSAYATMHPFEDFAETFAHYLHIADTLETAVEHGLLTLAPVTAFSAFRDVVSGVWVPLTIALNMVNRSMGKDDLYPFVIPPRVLDKLDFVAALRPAAG